VSETIIKFLSFFAFTGAVFAAGWGFSANHNSRLLVRQNAEVEKQQDKKAEYTNKIVAKYIYKDRIITKEVPHYVQVDNSCLFLDGAFRVYHDSNTGAVPSGAGDINDAPVSVEDLADTIQSNYQGCRKNANQLSALQEFVKNENR
jgi:hypothetical protein